MEFRTSRGQAHTPSCCGISRDPALKVLPTIPRALAPGSTGSLHWLVCRIAFMLLRHQALLALLPVVGLSPLFLSSTPKGRPPCCSLPHVVCKVHAWPCGSLTYLHRFPTEVPTPPVSFLFIISSVLTRDLAMLDSAQFCPRASSCLSLLHQHLAIVPSPALGGAGLGSVFAQHRPFPRHTLMWVSMSLDSFCPDLQCLVFQVAQMG